tara:strand:- start:280 stop:1416 length:1137 start_codon:yes stop_codon:yes gene_type:complete
MEKLKIITILGTRPEIIRLSRIMAMLDIHFDHRVVHTGQNHDYELNEIFFEDMNIRKPDFFLGAATGSFASTIGKIITEIDLILEKEVPDGILILGDTNSSLSAIAAKKRKIPIFHMEAGNRCFDQRVPEETNRKIVDHIADINMTYSNLAKDYLIREGFPPDQVIKVGSPMKEVINFNKNKINRSLILEKLNLKKNNYFLVSAHREENIDSDIMFRNLIDILNYLDSEYSEEVIVSTHPRTRKKIDKIESNILNKNIKFLKPINFSDYNKLQIESKAVLSDSGTINEESSILNFKALNIREAHERPESVEETSTIMTGLNLNRVKQGLKIIDDQLTGDTRNFNEVNDYQNINISEKIARIIVSHIDFINRKVWLKKY